MLTAPCTLAISIAATPTLLLAAVITTTSPRVIFACCTSAPYAVRYCIHIDVPCSAENRSG